MNEHIPTDSDDYKVLLDLWIRYGSAAVVDAMSHMILRHADVPLDPAGVGTGKLLPQIACSNAIKHQQLICGIHDCFRVSSSLQLLDALLCWEHYPKWSGIMNVDDWPCDIVMRPTDHSLIFPEWQYVFFDASRKGDLEYVELKVVEFWEKLRP